MLVYSKKITIFFLDVFLINLAYIFSLNLRFDMNVPQQYIDLYLKTSIIYTTIKLAFYFMTGIYKSLWKYAGVEDLIRIFISTAIGSIYCCITSVIIDKGYPKSIEAIAWMITFLFIGGSRISYRIIQRICSFINNRASKGCKGKTRILIVGAGDAGEAILRQLDNKKNKDYLPLALVDDDPGKLHKNIHGVRVKGNISEIKKVSEKEKIDEIIIAMPSVSKRVLIDVVKDCQKTGCKIKTLPGIYEMIDGKVTVNDLREVKIEDLLGREEVNLNMEEISRFLINETILVTGGGGSIGSELCRQIARFKPSRLIILDMYENNAYDIQNELKYVYPDIKLEVIIASVREYDRLDTVFETYMPSVVFHAAAHKHVPFMEHNPTEAIKNNVFGTFNTARCADKYGVKKFVLISTDKAVNPTSVMGATKRICEIIVQTFDKNSKTEFAAVRFGNVLGSNGSVIPLFKKQIANGGPVTVTHKEITRFFMTIPEAVRLVMQAGAIATGGEIFVLDMGDQVKIDNLARELIKLSGLEPDIDIPIEYTGLRPGEKLYEEILLNEEGLEATKQEGIYVAKPINISFGQLMQWLNMLSASIEKPNEIKCVLALIVPTYKYTEDTGKEDKTKKAIDFLHETVNA